MKIKVWIKDIRLKLKYILLGIKNIFRINILDIVIYDNRKYFVNNGTSMPVWDLIELDTRDRKRVNSKDFKKEISIRNIKNAIKGTYNFHMGYWHKINMRK